MKISHVKLKVSKKNQNEYFYLTIVSNLKFLNYSEMVFQKGKNYRIIIYQ